MNVVPDYSNSMEFLKFAIDVKIGVGCGSDICFHVVHRCNDGIANGYSLDGFQ